ncbi:hypothetical protein [Romboutsia sp. 1001216sp1]|uniref:hypothetical protein n=1 Tax=Romboutsia sp. 1001216sp1 TaxID=2986997 RepID=UPI00232BE8F3|nr:hypothetical protein [Romboutsia sp. 1001216sp1]MDB8805006.1 hypothetical protein [Romboutsia sp. 1001216sp1]MDB8807996.1 hypothetical protein [Romboutsia sp. 1001216sp1]MDB8810651.1 hypothetical protein [Romboutsia sp. 1001216sp1]MDB8816371.1 hypothetical protein [Romboutsia sp. 1001216sp1]MDB8818676.1 hypothetical protein [Romboutsia sp. 1001216sp1]
MGLKKVRVQLLNEETGAVIEEVDVVTSADAVTFADGETFQQKLNAGKLTGPKGATGERGIQGATGSQGPAGPQGPKGDKGDAGSQGSKGNTGTSMRFKGAWSSSVAYVCDSNYVDIVTSGGNTYRCKTSNTNQAVTNTTYWELISQRGSDGAKGATGERGPAGVQGTKGDTGLQGPKGDKGDRGPQGPAGQDGAGVSIGTSLGSATQGKLFFKIIG